MPKTPYDRYEYPEEGEEQWNRDPGPENIWEKQELEITSVVSTFSNLPEPDAQATTEDGQHRRYLVKDRNIIYRDTGNSWQPIAGHGSESNPVPETYVNNVQVGEFIEFEPLDATPSDPPEYGIWFVDDS